MSAKSLLLLSGVAVYLSAMVLAQTSTAPKGAKVWPPWTPPPTNGLNFTVPQIDDVPDLHGDIVDPQLVIFFAGNQFMATHELMDAFRQKHPEVQRIYWETLPPGILANQIDHGALIIGNLRIAIKADIYTAGGRRIKRFEQENRFESVETYAQNKLAIMVREGNPKGIRSLEDLARKDVRISMPNPEWEGIANLITESYKKAGGDELVNRIMKTKVRDGTTFLTHIHHRQTPIRIMLGESDAGVVWYSEAHFQQMIGNPIAMVEIPPEQNMNGIYQAGIFKGAPHAEAAKAFAKFLLSDKAQTIFRKYGFSGPPQEVKR